MTPSLVSRCLKYQKVEIELKANKRSQVLAVVRGGPIDAFPEYIEGVAEEEGGFIPLE